MRRISSINRLEDHPNLNEVLGVLAQLAHVADSDLPLLAKAWTNNASVAQARDRALSPDSPLVLEVLASFEAVAALFDDDLRGEADYVTIDPTVTTTALKSVRDAIAASYARPSLSRSDHTLLMRPWRVVYTSARGGEPDLGPNAYAVKALLSALLRLAGRCHDSASQEIYDMLVDRSFVDESDRAGARETAFQAAVLTNRRRVWTLVCRSGAEGLGRQCTTCRTDRHERAHNQRESSRVLALCLDAACALLVTDALSDELTALLTGPVESLIPLQRGA